MKIHKLLSAASLITVSTLLISTPVLADKEFIGRIDERPTGNLGIWTISGQKVEVTEKTDIEPEQGPLVVGACVEVEHKKGVASEIETIKPEKCGN
ncbi:DUF5666 domain-containing protein [Methylobacillus arboreus]|uniref:DUF5666 domain-containing protein n=1 Tax=Methylobacillus arboreus TaxID=755170 RepID=UPI001E4AC9AA|nr:DUF5666 domain-containing protein [Methylobacillus arboreus]MCB5190898.1 DUF5666 domain-containing protein [Methylobacillus arboreus]